MTFSIGDEVFVGSGTAPARIIALLDNDTAQVEWMMLGNGKWETVYPLTMLHAIGRQRRRTTKKEVKNENEKKSAQGSADEKAASKKKKKTSAVAPKRKRVTKKPQPAQKVTKKPSQAALSKRRTIKRAPIPKGKRTTAKKCTSSSDVIDYSQMDPNSVARARHYSSSSDEEPEPKNDYNSDDDRKPAAKPVIKINESSSDDSSDDELELAKTIKRHVEDRLFNGGRKEHKRAVKPRKQEYLHSRDDNDNETSASESETDGKVCKVGHQNSTTGHQQQVKQEPIVPPQRHVFQPGDHIWVQDGDKHPAEVISVLDDTLEIKWTSGFSSKTVMVPKSSATLMFDLTADDDDGRPRRSARARRKPDLLASPPVKKAAVKPSIRSKKKTGRAAKSQQKKKKRKGSVAKPKQARNVAMYCASSDSDTSTDMESVIDAAKRSRSGTFAMDSVIPSSSSNDENSDAQSIITEATFEFTAPDVDPKFRSIHVITDINTFMKREPWKKEGESTLLQDVPSRLECESDVMDEKASADASHTEPRSSLLDIDFEESRDNHRQSTDTANPEEIPDIFRADSEEPATSEGRLTADSQELSRAFAAFGHDSDLNTQPETMCT